MEEEETLSKDSEALGALGDFPVDSKTVDMNLELEEILTRKNCSKCSELRRSPQKEKTSNFLLVFRFWKVSYDGNYAIDGVYDVSIFFSP